MVASWSVALAFGMVLLSGGSLPAQHVKAQSKGQAAPSQVPLSLVAAQVVKTLDAFNAQAESKALPKLSRVTFDFNVTGTQGAGFSFNILIFKLGASRETSTTNEVTFTYSVPASPPTPALAPRTQPATHDVSAALLQLLQAAAEQVKGTQTVGTARFTDLTVTLSYAAVWDSSVDASGTLSLVTLDGSVDRKRSDVQTLTLYFGP